MPSTVNCTGSLIWSFWTVILALDPLKIVAHEQQKAAMQITIKSFLINCLFVAAGSGLFNNRHTKNVEPNFYLLSEVFAIPMQPNKVKPTLDVSVYTLLLVALKVAKFQKAKINVTLFMSTYKLIVPINNSSGGEFNYPINAS